MATIIPRPDLVRAAARGVLTAEAFNERLRAEGLTVKGFARLTGINQRTAYGWSNGEHTAPQWAMVVLDLLAEVRVARQPKLPPSRQPF